MKVQKLAIACIFCVLINYSYGQIYGDPAQSYTLRDIQNSGKYIVIGNYKVLGTPYLYGPDKKGDIYGKNEYGADVKMNYNTYLQQLEFTMNSQANIVKEEPEVDSFILKKDGENYFTDLKFINAQLLGCNEKCFFQLISNGDKFTLYKKFSTKLEIVSTNYIQSDLRQFALNVEYYYFDTATKTLKKLKITKNSIVKEFKNSKDLTQMLQNTNMNADTENVLKDIFKELNS